MPAHRGEQTKIETKLAAIRVAKGVTQEELARVVGISRTSLIRLEHRRLRNPPLGWLVNCAIVLGVELDDVLEERDRTWHFYDQRHPPPLDWIDHLPGRS